MILAFSGFGFLDSCFERRGGYLLSFFFRLIFFNFSGKIIVQNSDDFSRCLGFGLGRDQIKLISGSGFDFKMATNLRLIGTPLPKVSTFLFASRLLRSKGVLDFVHLADVLKKKYPDILFYIAGAYDSKNVNAISHSDFCKITNSINVKFLGFRSDSLSIINSATCVVLPSNYGEGLPKILIEAASLGRVVLTTNHKGCRNAVIHGKTGFVYNKNDIQKLISYAEMIHLDKEMTLSLSENAYQFARKNFDVEDVVDAHMEIYRSLENSRDAKMV